jgi:hypothetical protein
MNRRLGIGLLVVGVLALVPGRAHAHLVTTGMGPVYDGILHLVISPGDLFPILALGMLAGLQGATHGRRVLIVAPAAWLIGGLAGLFFPIFASPAVLTPLAFLLVGGLVAGDLRISIAWMTMLAVGLGLIYGFLNGAGLARAQAGSVGLIGISVTVFALCALVSAFVVSLRSPWARIVVRVAGSWMVAIGLLMLGWLYRGVA